MYQGGITKRKISGACPLKIDWNNDEKKTK